MVATGCKMEPYMQRVRAISDSVASKTITIRDETLQKIGVQPQDLTKLNGIPLLCSIVGLVVNLSLLLAMGNHAWVKATALSNGQPFTAYLSLTSVQFGNAQNPTADSGAFCETNLLSHSCELGALCAKPDDPATFPNALPKNTPAEVWCVAARAGATAMSLLWLGFIPGLAATAFTFFYAARDIPSVARYVIKVQDMGFTTRNQEMIIAGCWAILWLFEFMGMTVFALMVPDSLGWGNVSLEASFGLLRFSFVTTSIFGAILIAKLFTLWDPHNVAEAWMEFVETKLLTFKKALYLELMLQLILYLFMVVATVDWSGLLIVLAFFYLDAKNRNFMIMYIVLVTISMLFDIVHAASLPSFSNMTPGESFGASLWIVIFLLKPLILATIYAYEQYERPSEDGAGGGNTTYTTFKETAEDEIAE